MKAVARTKFYLSRLQSRISVRRNVIRSLEEDIAHARLMDKIFGTYNTRQLREAIKILAEEQKLDKHLYAAYLWG